MKYHLVKYTGMIGLLLYVNLAMAQEIPVYDFKKLEPRLHQSDDTIYIVNFWASWCIPCVKEMHVFNELHQKYKNKNVKVLLVSLDFPKHIKSRLFPFIQEHKVLPEVVLLDEPDANKWIDKVNPKWSGALPATLIYTKNKREFYEQTFTYSELETIIKSKL